MGARLPFPSAMPRHAGLTIIEVMIALMVFAVVLSAIASSWFTLRSVRRLTQDEAKVHEIAQTLSERITGANWDWIGRDRPDESKTVTVVVDDSVDPPITDSVDVVERYWRRYGWSWHRREFPRTVGGRIRLPPLTDHDWTPDDYLRFRADAAAPLTSEDVDHTDLAIPPAQRINPHNLIDLGLLDGPSGLANLQIYVEYYHATMLDALFIKDAAGEVVPYWKEVVAGKQDPDLIFPESPFADDDPETQMNPADSRIAMQALVVRIIVTWGDQPKMHRHEVVLARRK